MKICVTAQEDNLDSLVDPRFGRAKFFIFIDSETLDFQAVENPNVDGMGGVGIQSAQFLIDKEVSVLLTGNVGPNAFNVLNSAGIKIVSNLSSTVKDVVEQFKQKKLKPTDNASVDSHFGMK